MTQLQIITKASTIFVTVSDGYDNMDVKISKKEAKNLIKSSLDFGIQYDVNNNAAYICNRIEEKVEMIIALPARRNADTDNKRKS